MKPARVVLLCVATAMLSLVLVQIYETRDTASAEASLQAWISGAKGLFLPERGADEEALRMHCSAGVTRLEIAEAEPGYVEFRVWNSRQKAFLVTVGRSNSQWHAQALPIR